MFPDAPALSFSGAFSTAFIVCINGLLGLLQREVHMGLITVCTRTH